MDNNLISAIETLITIGGSIILGFLLEPLLHKMCEDKQTENKENDKS